MKKLFIAAIAALIVLCALSLCLADTSENMDIVYTYLTETLGLNRAAACGIMSNIQYESNFRPEAIGDSGAAYGICQWNSRRQSLIYYCENNGFDGWQDIYGQLGYLGYELEHNKKSVGAYLHAVEDSPQGAYQAGYWFCVYFEIPANRFEKGITRGKTAVTKYFVKYGGSYETYSVSYRLNGGSGSIESQSKIEGVPVKVASAIPVRAGYTFAGWALDENAGSAEYVAGDLINIDANTILYAVWKQNVSGNLLYEVTDKGVRIIGITGDEFQISIPETIDGMSVTGISAGTFCDIDGLLSVCVPENVSDIEQGAFGENVMIAAYPASPAHYYAIENNLRLELIYSSRAIRLSGELESIGAEAFAGLDIEYADLCQTNLTAIQSGAFDGCTSLKAIRLGASVSYIAPNAIPQSAIIIAPNDSYAQGYAKQNGNTFIAEQQD